MQNPAAAITRALTPQQIQARLETLEVQQALTNGVSTVIDSVLADSYQSGKWEIALVKGASRLKATVEWYHDGTSAADAVNVYWTIYGPDDVGTVDVVISCDLNGAAGAQLVRLVALASSTGWTAEAWRVPQKPAQL